MSGCGTDAYDVAGGSEIAWADTGIEIGATNDEDGTAVDATGTEYAGAVEGNVGTCDGMNAAVGVGIGAGIGCKGAAEECDSDGIGTCVETGSASETGAIVETAVGTDTTEVLTVHVTGDGMWCKTAPGAGSAVGGAIVEAVVGCIAVRAVTGTVGVAVVMLTTLLSM